MCDYVHIQHFSMSLFPLPFPLSRAHKHKSPPLLIGWNRLAVQFGCVCNTPDVFSACTQNALLTDSEEIFAEFDIVSVLD